MDENDDKQEYRFQPSVYDVYANIDTYRWTFRKKRVLNIIQQNRVCT